MSEKSQRSGARGRNSSLVFLPLGGAGEIGMNMYLYGCGTARNRQWLMVDCGVKFGDERDPGIDVIVPDVSFIEAQPRALQAVVLTHAHEDHMGALPWLLPTLDVPVYCTPFAAGLVQRKFAELESAFHPEIRIVDLGDRIEIGDFDVEFVGVTHSIPEPAALIIRTPDGTAVHSGDWKLDRRPAIPPDMNEARLREVGAEGVDALICDSTNVLREGHSPSESDVADTLADIVEGARNRVVITTFASHVGRIISAIKAARATGREVVVAGRALRRVIEVAREVGLMKDAGTFIDEEAYGFLPRDKTMLICTGSQGEARAALARIAGDSHPTISLDKGDLVLFSSKTIPGNEKAVAGVINNLSMLGVDVITSDEALIHSSGHPRQDEIAELYHWLGPRAVVPMHGEPRHVKRHAEFAIEQGIAEAVVARNGDLIRLNPGPLEAVDDAGAGRVHVDGRVLVEADDGPARQRRRLMFAGVVSVSVVLDAKGNILSSPVADMEGVPQRDTDGRDLLQSFANMAADALDTMPRARRQEDEAVVEMIRGAVRRLALRDWGKKPRCQVHVHRL